MLTMEVVKELCRAIALENTGLSDDSLSGEVSGIVYRCDVVDCGEVDITNRHIDVEYSFGDCYEIAEGTPLYQRLSGLCGLPPEPDEGERILYQW